jgi:hypothetical protein
MRYVHIHSTTHCRGGSLQQQHGAPRHVTLETRHSLEECLHSQHTLHTALERETGPGYKHTLTLTPAHAPPRVRALTDQGSQPWSSPGVGAGAPAQAVS